MLLLFVCVVFNGSVFCRKSTRAGAGLEEYFIASAGACVCSRTWTGASKPRCWCVAEVCDFLERADLHGPAQVCRQNGVAGADLLELTEAGLQTDLRFTPFAARKIVTVRDAFLV